MPSLSPDEVLGIVASILYQALIEYQVMMERSCMGERERRGVLYVVFISSSMHAGACWDVRC